MQYNLGKPESSNAQVNPLAKMNEDEKFQQTAYVKYKVEKFIYPLDAMSPV